MKRERRVKFGLADSQYEEARDYAHVKGFDGVHDLARFALVQYQKMRPLTAHERTVIAKWRAEEEQAARTGADIAKLRDMAEGRAGVSRIAMTAAEASESGRVLVRVGEGGTVPVAVETGDR
ncbi:MAG: hypothetical protein WC683_03850 [bacterium]